MTLIEPIGGGGQQPVMIAMEFAVPFEDQVGRSIVGRPVDEELKGLMEANILPDIFDRAQLGFLVVEIRQPLEITICMELTMLEELFAMLDETDMAA